MSVQSLHFQLIVVPPPIWVQFGEVAFSVNFFTAPYSPIWIQFWRLILTHVPLPTPRLMMIGLSQLCLLAFYDF